MSKHTSGWEKKQQQCWWWKCCWRHLHSTWAFSGRCAHLVWQQSPRFLFFFYFFFVVSVYPKIWTDWFPWTFLIPAPKLLWASASVPCTATCWTGKLQVPAGLRWVLNDCTSLVNTFLLTVGMKLYNVLVIYFMILTEGFSARTDSQFLPQIMIKGSTEVQIY